MTDPIAERARKIGGTTLRSIGHIARTQRIADNDAEYVEPQDMLSELRDDNQRLTSAMREVHNICDKYNLTKAGADKDPELLAAARKLTELIQQQAPGVAAAIGVDLKEVEAANLRLADIAASGTGVRVEHGTFTGDIDIRGVRAGAKPEEPPERR